jgi:hypothetical protein
VVADGERVAVVAVEGLELALEVGVPHLVRMIGDQGCGPRMLPLLSSTLLVQLTVALEDGVDGAPGGPELVGLTLVKHLQQLLGAQP